MLRWSAFKIGGPNYEEWRGYRQKDKTLYTIYLKRYEISVGFVLYHEESGQKVGEYKSKHEAKRAAENDHRERNFEMF